MWSHSPSLAPEEAKVAWLGGRTGGEGLPPASSKSSCSWYSGWRASREEKKGWPAPAGEAGKAWGDEGGGKGGGLLRENPWSHNWPVALTGQRVSTPWAST